MKRVLLAGVGLFALAIAAQPVAAADVPTARPVLKAPVATQTFDWTGWYGGVNAGVGMAQSRGVTAEDFGSFDRGGAGFAGGVQGGYNWQLSPLWVAGIEGDIGYLGINRSFSNWDNDTAFGVKTDWYGTIRGRLGYSAGPALLYVTGGAAFVNVKNNFDDRGGTPTSASRSEIAAGWTVGGGIETMLGGSWSAKAEYLYIDAGSQDVFNPEVFGTARTAHFDNRFHVFRYGLNHRFGGSSRPVTLPSYNWTGFYVGVHMGGGLSQVHAYPNPSEGLDIAGVGFGGGVQGGYNWQIHPHWVAGIEGDIGYLAIDRSFLNWDQSAVLGVKTDWYGTIRGRLGYSAGPALLYVTGGAAWVTTKNKIDFGGVSASESETAAGWTVGGGIEAVLVHNWTAKVEYLYIDAGHQDVFNSALAGGTTMRFDNRFHVFRFGLNYQFATGKAPVVARY